MSGQGSYLSRAHEGAGDIAHARDSIITEKFAIYYRFDRTDIDTSYLDNPQQIRHILNYLEKSQRIDSITIYAWASPEGTYHHNRRLSEGRAKTAREFLLQNCPDTSKLNDGKIRISPLAENWPGLIEKVEAGYHRHDREKVLNILRNGTIGDETRKWRLKQLDGGYTWSYLVRRYMAGLRAATWICVWEKVAEPVATLAMTEDRVDACPDPIVMPSGDYTPVVRPVVEQPLDTTRRTILALKTNLLYDAVTALNAEIEIPIGDRWSVAVEDTCPWWTWGPNDNKYAFQVLQLGVEPRWWFLKGAEGKRLTGHYIGAYAMSSMYDFQWDRELCYQGEGWSAGLSYGYAFRIGKLLRLELSASVGYLQTDYRHYQPDPEYNRLYVDNYQTGTLRYFGPTKLKVSLVLPINVLIKERR